MKSVREAPPRFHARWSALSRRYRYRLATPGSPAPRAWVLDRMPDAGALRDGLARVAAAPTMRGFCSEAKDAPALTTAALETDGDALTVTLEAPAFGKREVRNLVASLVNVALGRAAPSMLATLAGSRWPYHANAAPPNGLTLEAVCYPPDLDPFV